MNRRVTTCLKGFSFTVSAAALLVHAAPALAQNLHVSGKVGIATSSPNLPLQVASCGVVPGDCVAKDVSASGGGFAMFGDQAGNLAFDDNEIMVRKNGQAGNLYINNDGGNIFLGSTASGYTKVGSGLTAGGAGAARLIIEGGSDIAVGDALGEGVVQVGATGAPHLIIDNDEIMTRLGPNGGTTLFLNSFPGGLVQATIQAPSDASLKTDIEPIRGALEKLGVLRGVTWRWKDSHGGSLRSMGVIAQEVERVFPDIVRTDPRDGMKSVQYDALVGPLIAGVNELAAENQALEAERTLLDERVAELETTLDTRVRELSSENDQLKEQLRKLAERMDALETGGRACAR